MGEMNFLGADHVHIDQDLKKTWRLSRAAKDPSLVNSY
jgi:hypothetical protein